MPIDPTPSATIDRVSDLCDAVHDALKEGLRVATESHRQLGYSPPADMHFFHHAVRREAMEQLKQLNPHLEDQDNLGFAMSGLVLTTTTDVIRVWHTAEVDIPSPSSERAINFVTQRAAWSPPALFSSIAADEEEEGALEGTKRNHLILQWTEAGAELARFRLVRPTGVGGRPVRVEQDWSHNLLPETGVREDLGYRRKDGGQERAEGDG